MAEATGKVPEDHMQMMGAAFCCASCSVGKHDQCTAPQPCGCPGCNS